MQSTDERIRIMSDPQGQFGTATRPSESQSLAEGFRNRTRQAGQMGFVGGFPNFYFADASGGRQVGGTIFVRAPGAVWRDVPLSELGSPSLDDFGARMRATQDYAGRAGFVGGFPTFFHADYGDGIVCGTTLLTAEAAEWRDVPQTDLGNLTLNDVEQRFRGTQDYAGKNGFVGGFPNMYDALKPPEKVIDPNHPAGRHTVCGTILLRAPLAQWQDVVLRKPPA